MVIRWSILIFALVGFTLSSLQAQDPVFQKRFFYVGLVPGVGTNGIDPKNYKNSIALSLFSNYSAANHGLEMSGISTFHTNSSSGIQLSGIANIIGGNRKDLGKYTQIELVKLSSDFSGIQVAGIVNLVTGDLSGFQLGGFLNKLHTGDLSGFQLAGAINYTGGHSDGMQIAGLVNVAMNTFTGVQLASLINNVRGDLYGCQLGVWNSARNFYGPRSGGDLGYGLQVGLFNISTTRMDGAQIGLINSGTEVLGFQLGLININRKSHGFPIGLINIGEGRTGLKLGYDNLADLSIHVMTGSKHIINSAVVGYETLGSNHFLIGYSLGRARFFNERGMYLHSELMIRCMNFKFKNFEFNPVYSLQTSLGIHIDHGFYVYFGGGVNYDEKEYTGKSLFPAYTFGISGLY